MKRLVSLVVIILPIILVVGWLTNEATSVAQKNAIQSFPAGDWKFSAHPYMGEGFKTRPVVVTSVGSEATTLSVTKVRVKNISSKRVLAVKLGWSLYDERNKDKILGQGESPLITMDRDFPSDSDQILKTVVVSFMDIDRPLIRNGRLDGDYRLDVGVTQVLFDDRTTWSLGQAVSFKRRRSLC
jgi:hypothetical protein